MIRVKKGSSYPVCPVCGRDHYCLVSEDGTVAVCTHIESDHVVGTKGAGWLHNLTNTPVPVKDRPKRRPVKQEPKPDFSKLARQCQKNLKSVELAALAAELGVSVKSLLRLSVGCGYFYGRNWQTYPMWDGKGRVVGLRLRNARKKMAVAGSKNALFWPTDVKADADSLLFIGEGPTETVALLDLGFDAIGRASCNTGLEYIITMIGRFNRRVVIVADHDEPKKRPDGSVSYPGIEGARRLANDLKSIVANVRIVMPPHSKDVREWRNAGATRSMIMALVDNARFI